MIRKTKTLLFIYLILFFTKFTLATAITEDMRENSEEAIARTMKTYTTLQNLKNAFADQMNSYENIYPWSAEFNQNFYSQEKLYLKAFQTGLDEFSEFMLKIDTVRKAPSPNELRDRTIELSSNTRRFDKGLKGFVEWVLVGKTTPGYDIIYKDWMREAAAKLKEENSEIIVKSNPVVVFKIAEPVTVKDSIPNTTMLESTKKFKEENLRTLGERFYGDKTFRAVLLASRK